ncbi:MAG TPA: ATP-binding cassette domain-containing protein [Steroidobacteraceae bacterium]|nr:ATP-binding cassette domain-containing protein [Steroidobacteraceae bacterium]
MPSARVSQSQLAVTLRHVDLDRGGRAVLRDVSWRIRPGQRWLLVGGNGAGKTQLLKMVSGAVWPKPDRGQRRYRTAGEIFDTPAGVAEEIAYVGAERQDRYEHYDWNFTAHEVVGTGLHRTDIPMRALTPAEDRRVAALLGRLGVAKLAARRFLTLSYGERRLVLIARALASRPRLLLLDEVANGLDAKHHAIFLGWLDSTARSRMPWVFATHRRGDVPESMTHLLELERGRVKRAGAMRAPRARELLEQEAAVFLAKSPRRRARPSGRRRVLVSLERADVFVDDVQILHRIGFEIASGDCWVVHGANGSGKSTLLRTLYGDHPVAAGGAIRRAGIAPGVPLETFKLRTAYVAPHLQTWHAPKMPVMEAVASGRHASIGLNQAITAADRRHAERALRRFGILGLRERTLAEMSYGQARRVLFARAWAREPVLALLDEPFAGLDRPTRADLAHRLNRWLEAGGSCVIATHHRDEWPAHTTHVLELSQGRAVACHPLGN